MVRSRLARVLVTLLVLGFAAFCVRAAWVRIAARWAKRSAPAQRSYSDVDMISDGSAPRVTLRVARWPGLRYRFVIRSAGALGLENQPLVFGPTVTMTFDNDVVRGSADPIVERRNGAIMRLIEERSVLEGIHVSLDTAPKPLVDFWNQALVPLRGTAFKQRVTELAGIAWLKTELLGGQRPPDAVRAALDGALETQRHFPFRLPPVAVGTGARWRFHEQVTVNGAQVLQIAEMSLKSIDANLAVVGLVIRQEAPRQEVPHPLVPGQKAMLEQFQGWGDGELTVDRLTAIVVQGHFAGRCRFTLSGDVAGKHGVATLIGASLIRTDSTILPDADAGADDPEPLQPGPATASTDAGGP